MAQKKLIQHELDKFRDDGAISEVYVTSVETPPTDPSRTNPSTVLSYTGDHLDTITETISGVDYQTTITYTGDKITGVSAVVQI